MNQEKLNEAAAEARRSSAETFTALGTQISIDDIVALTDMRLSYDEIAESAFIKGAEWHESLPIAQRLTPDEAARIKGYYSNPGFNHILGHAIDSVLTLIFGDELFTNRTE